MTYDEFKTLKPGALLNINLVFKDSEKEHVYMLLGESKYKNYPSNTYIDCFNLNTKTKTMALNIEYYDIIK